MSFDWFTFFAQIVNFVILIALLQRVLYGPILNAMRAREERLAARFKAAELARQQAEEEAALFHERRSDLEAKQQQLLDDAAKEAADARKRMMAESRQEVDRLSARWFDALEHEKEAFLQEVRERIGAEVVEVARQTLADLGDVQLEEQVAKSFARRLLHLSAADRHALIVSGAAFEEDVVIRSTFDLSDRARQEIVQALQQLLVLEAQGNGVDYSHIEEIGVRFEHADDLICGIDLIVRDRRVAWSVDDYLTALGDDLLDVAGLEAELS
jgi:F-type H+-transporting ATPase subunit b